MSEASNRSALLSACGLQESATDEALDIVAQLLECITDAFVFLDRDWRYRYVNARAGAMFGRAPKDLIGKHIWTEFPEGVGQPFHLAYERAMRDQVVVEIEELYPPWQRWFENRIHPSKDGLAIFFQDVTERHALQEERRRAQEELRTDALARAEAERMAHLGYWRWDVLTNRVEWSEELFRIYGLDAAEFGASFEAYIALVHPHDRGRVLALVAEARASLSAVAFEERIVRPSGEVRHLCSWGSVTRDASGRAVEMFGACLDTTQLIQATQALRRSEEWLEVALDAASLGLWDWHIRTNEVVWSEAVERVFGMAPGTFGGTYDAFLGRIHADDRERVDAAIRRSVDTNVDYAIDFRVLWPDGTVRWLASKGKVIRDEQGHAVRMAGSVRDVTEQRRAEDERRKFALLVENATDFIGLAATDGRILFVNEAGRRMVGLDSLEEALTKRVGDLLTPEGMRQSLELELPAVVATGRWEGETQLVHFKTGKRIDVLVASFLVRDPATSAPLCLATVRHDVTKRRGLEEQLRQAQKMEAIGQLAAGVAHDFNNILAIVLGMAGLVLRDDTLSDQTRSNIDEIEAAGERAALLTRQLLAFSRQDAYEPVVLDLNEVVTDTVKMARRLLPSNIDVRVELASSALRVRADRGQLEQVVLNLVVNARDAMPEGGALTVGTRDDGDRVALSVADTGVGMSSEVQASAFQPFFTTKEIGRGTGLGLSTIHGIVSQAGGDIALVSAPGAGTTFTVRLMRSAEPAAALPPSGRASKRRARAAAAAEKMVLLVEEDANVRLTIKQILEAEGYRVLDTGSPDNALRLFEAHGAVVSLLVASTRMRGMGARELTRCMRARSPALRVLFVAGVPDDHDAHTPSDPILQKPFTADALAETVRGLLDADESPASRA